jgi:hypothetical protein
MSHCPGYRHTSGRDTPAVVPAEPAGATAGTMIIPPQFIIQFIILPLPLDPVSAPLPEIYGPTHRLTLWLLARSTTIGLAPIPPPRVTRQA